MYKIYGVTQGETEVDYSLLLPWVEKGGTKGLIEFYLWCIKGEEASVLVDTGMTDNHGKNTCTAKFYGGEKYIEDRLRKLGADPASIEIVIVSHLHLDHFSAYDLYPKATFYIQAREMEFFTGPLINFPQVIQSAANMPEIISLAYAKRIRYLNGNEEIAPGIRVVLIGGHTPGSQVVVVTTNKGQAVICGDTVHLYRTLEEGVAGSYVDLKQFLLGFDKIKALASTPELIIPSHDPLILEKFTSPIEGVVEIV